MWDIAICDDNPADARQLAEKIEALHLSQMYRIREFNSGHELLDEIADFEEAKAAFISQQGLDEDTVFFTPKNDIDFFTSLFMKAKDILPKSEIDLATDIMENRGSVVLKYYAE